MNEKQQVVKNGLRVFKHAKKIRNIRKHTVISAYPDRAIIGGNLLMMREVSQVWLISHLSKNWDHFCMSVRTTMSNNYWR